MTPNIETIIKDDVTLTVRCLDRIYLQGYRTRVITDGVEPSLHIEYKHSHLKQYFKDGHSPRTELTINNPKDFGVTSGLDRLPAWRALGDDVNRTLLTVERVSHHGTFTTPWTGDSVRCRSSASASPRCASAIRACRRCSKPWRAWRNCPPAFGIGTCGPASLRCSAVRIPPPT